MTDTTTEASHGIKMPQTARLMWIDAMLSTTAPLQRQTISDAWGIGIAQTSKDLAEYARRFPDAIRYDNAVRGYFRPDGARPVFATADRALIEEAQERIAAAARRLNDGGRG